MDSLVPVAVDAPLAITKPGLVRAKIAGLIVVALPLVFGATRAMASLYLRDDVRVVAKRADAVVFGRIERAEASWVDGRITSDAVVQVSSAFKGQTPAEIHVVVPGGTVAGVRMRVAGEPEPRAGDETVLFLVRHGAGAAAHFHVVDGLRGYAPVARDAQGNPTVRWTRPETGRFEQTPLAELGEYVHRISLEPVK